ncbi:unnamed protein product [Cercospora beticola]|nr:unnamed protein product [Cercospora beticola]
MEKSPYGLAANRSSDADFRATPQDLYNDLGKTYEDAYKQNEAQVRSLQWASISPPKCSLTPVAKFIEADILSSTPPSSSEEEHPDAIVAYFSTIGHVTQNDIRAFFRKVHTLLTPSGIFIYASVPLEGNEIFIQWMDRVFPSSSFTAENTLLGIEAAGFEILKYEIVKFRPDRGEESLEETQIFVYARKKEST